MISPAYFIKTGIFSQINDGFVTQKLDSAMFMYGRDYSEVKSQKPFSISEMLSGIITEFKNRYIGGRGEFYNSKSLVLVDGKKNFLGTLWIGGGGTEFKKMNDTLYQCRFLPDLDNDMGPGDNFPEKDYPIYRYFKFGGKKLTILKIDRRFEFTKIIRMDSSYLLGNFEKWDGAKETFLSTEEPLRQCAMKFLPVMDLFLLKRIK